MIPLYDEIEKCEIKIKVKTYEFISHDACEGTKRKKEDEPS